MHTSKTILHSLAFYFTQRPLAVWFGMRSAGFMKDGVEFGDGNPLQRGTRTHRHRNAEP